jgi:serine/threonine protein kinase
LKEINHPFVIKYKDEFVYKEEKVCIVTELVNGGDLGLLIKER